MFGLSLCYLKLPHHVVVLEAGGRAMHAILSSFGGNGGEGIKMWYSERKGAFLSGQGGQNPTSSSG